MRREKTYARRLAVETILGQYQDEHDTVAHKRTRYAVKALSAFFSGKDINKVDIPLCRAYVSFRADTGIADSTIARELTVLRAAANHAKKWKRITNDEMPVFEMPKNLPKREIWLFKDEIQKLLAQSPAEVANFVRLCYGTGSRKRAVEELEWSQVNFSRRTINLAKPNEPKTNKRRPVVPMGDLYDLLVDLNDEAENRWVLGSNRDMSYEFEKALKAANLLHVEERDGRPAGKITPHVLRHSRATHLLEDGVSIYAVAKLLGDTPMTVQKTYGHISMVSLEDELNKSGGLI